MTNFFQEEQNNCSIWNEQVVLINYFSALLHLNKTTKPHFYTSREYSYSRWTDGFIEPSARMLKPLRILNVKILYS